MGTPARCASSLRGSTCVHEGHRKQWSGDAVAAVEALIHAVDTLLRRAWKPYAKGAAILSRAGGPAEARRDVSSRAGKKRRWQNLGLAARQTGAILSPLEASLTMARGSRSESGCGTQRSTRSD